MFSLDNVQNILWVNTNNVVQQKLGFRAESACNSNSMLGLNVL